MININNTPWGKLQAEDVKKQISKTETSESFFFEFKEDDESPSKLMKEVSAFANTYGGYIFIGVDDKKTIKGCQKWNENRVHTTIHDYLSPIPLFDVKTFLIDNVDVLVIRIEEGLNPPYIVKDGRIYERVSSGSFPITDTSKLSELYRKKQEYYNHIAKTIEIQPLDPHVLLFPQNVCASIDVGVYVKCREKLPFSIDFYDSNTYGKIESIINQHSMEHSISIVGQRILITIAQQTAKDMNDNPAALGGGIQNFFEIMRDGSFRYRILLATGKDNNMASITIIHYLVYVFSQIYCAIVGDNFCDNFLFAEKYQNLSVFKQFIPYYFINNTVEQSIAQAHKQLLENHVKLYGGNYIVIGNRFPPTDYLHLDHAIFNEFGIEWNTKSVISELFGTVYSHLGFIETAKS